MTSPSTRPTELTQPGAIEPEEVHVWVASLEIEAAELSRSEALLSADERVRARRLRRGEDRARFIAAGNTRPALQAVRDGEE